MNTPFDVSIILCTYNRCETLRDALESLASQDAGTTGVEVLIVDNNSSDGTRELVARFTAIHSNWVYVFEQKQGLSHARNAGVARARAPIVAFTDDDVRVPTDWATQIKSALDAHPEVDFVGGKVLPRWGRNPPAWLTRAHWSPLALVDYGEEPFYVDEARSVCMVGANLSLRKQVLIDVGGFRSDFQRVRDSIGSTEDHELQLRLWRSGRRGMYVPSIAIEAEVQDERLRKRYHRTWHAGHGRFCAMMHTEESAERMPEVFGVPARFVRGLLGHAVAYVKAAMSGRVDAVFLHETMIRYWIGYLRTYAQIRPPQPIMTMLSHTARAAPVVLGRKSAARQEEADAAGSF